MKNFRFILLLSAGLFSLNACQKESVSELTKSDSNITAASQAILSWQECADFTNYDMNVCFTGANEYRCPCDVNCFWAGSVEYTLTVTAGDQKTIVTLQPPGNPTNAPSSAVVGKALISIEEPTPVDCANYEKYETYKIKVTVTDNTNEMDNPTNGR
ncbi:MAG TPA: hypothetical protein PLO67_17615 [Saprospiraceae bacterium]|nr:hypothetical protein [Saprospiraceae bacterium]HPI07539.1 hypothetical protein [Saprospiraceae bacterium]